MYISNDVPISYNKIAELSDNYIVLVRESTLNLDRSYDAYVQYFFPSIWCEHITDYVPKNYSSISFDFNYQSNNFGSYISDINANMVYQTSTLLDRSDNIYDRADYPVILFAQMLLVFIFVWILHQLSKLIVKGGAFS